MGRDSAAELLELYDSSDRLDQELRIRKMVLIFTPLISCVLAVPLLIALFLRRVPFFVAYPLTFVITLGALLYAVRAERRRLRDERAAIQDRIRQIEDAAGQ